jgi:hypothetical protein
MAWPSYHRVRSFSSALHFSLLLIFNLWPEFPGSIDTCVVSLRLQPITPSWLLQDTPLSLPSFTTGDWSVRGSPTTQVVVMLLWPKRELDAQMSTLSGETL